jgi:hypothetical protein
MNDVTFVNVHIILMEVISYSKMIIKQLAKRVNIRDLL